MSQKKELAIIKAEATKIRLTLDLYALMTDYRYYDKELCGACAVASGKLQKILKTYGIKSTLYMGYHKSLALHCWLETDNYLVDITFTQFNYKADKVLIISKKSPKYLDYRDKKIWKKISLAKHDLKYWFGSESPKYWTTIKRSITQNRINNFLTTYGQNLQHVA